MLLSFGILRRLLYVRGLRPGEKLAFLPAVNQHETNRGKGSLAALYARHLA